MIVWLLAMASPAIAQAIHPVALVVTKIGADERRKAHEYAATQAAAEHFRKLLAETSAALFVPLQTAKGKALQAFGIRNRDPALLQQALTALGEAASGGLEDSDPMRWSDLQVDIGDTLFDIATTPEQPDPELLRQSIDAYKLALSELDPPEIEINRWLTAKMRVVDTLVVLGKATRDVEVAREMVRNCDDLFDRPQLLTPSGWTEFAFDRAEALRLIGQASMDPSDLRTAVAAYQEVLRPELRASDQGRWSDLQLGYGNALSRLASVSQRADSTAYSNRAIAAWSAGLEIMTRAVDPEHWSIFENNIGYEMVLIGDHTDDPSQYQAAIPILREAASVQANVPDQLPLTQDSLCHALLGAGRAHGDRAMLLEGKGICEISIKGQAAINGDPAETQANLDAINAALAALG